MDADGNSKDDVKLPEGDLGKEITAGFEEGKDLLVTIISAMNEEQVRFYFTPPFSNDSSKYVSELTPV